MVIARDQRDETGRGREERGREGKRLRERDGGLFPDTYCTRSIINSFKLLSGGLAGKRHMKLQKVSWPHK